MRSKEERRWMRCGYLPAAERKGPGANIGRIPVAFPVRDLKGNVVVDQCPGWLISLPRVFETQIAYLWAEKGNLKDRFPEAEDITALMDHVQILSGENSQVESWLLTKDSPH